MYIMCLYFAFFLCRTKFSGYVKKQKTKREQESNPAWFFFLITQPTSVLQFLKGNSLCLCFAKCHNVPEVFLKIFCWLTTKPFFYHRNCCHFYFNTIKALIVALHCYLLCHRCLLRVTAGQYQLTKEKTNPRSVWPTTSPSFSSSLFLRLLWISHWRWM